MIALIAVLACGSNVPVCGPGFVPNPDGNCYEDTSNDPVPPSWDDAIDDAYDDLPARDRGEGDGELDLERGCASGACLGMTRAEIEAVLGEPDDVAVSNSAWVILDWWSLGTEVWFYDPGNTDVAEPDAIASGVQVYPGYAGSTDDGLSPEQSLRCFVDVLGDPDSITFRDSSGWGISTMNWGDSLTVWDYADGNELGHDGRADYIYMD